VISHTTKKFRESFQKLPPQIQRQAKNVFKLFRKDPYNPVLHFGQVHPTEPIYSVRIGLGWRAVGIKQADHVAWFWIGSHADYDNLLSKLRK
jgi:hypothetical protein